MSNQLFNFPDDFFSSNIPSGKVNDKTFLPPSFQHPLLQSQSIKTHKSLSISSHDEEDATQSTASYLDRPQDLSEKQAQSIFQGSPLKNPFFLPYLGSPTNEGGLQSVEPPFQLNFPSSPLFLGNNFDDDGWKIGLDNINEPIIIRNDSKLFSSKQDKQKEVAENANDDDKEVIFQDDTSIDAPEECPRLRRSTRNRPPRCQEMVIPLYEEVGRKRRLPVKPSKEVEVELVEKKWKKNSGKEGKNTKTVVESRFSKPKGSIQNKKKNIPGLIAHRVKRCCLDCIKKTKDDVVNKNRGYIFVIFSERNLSQEDLLDFKAFLKGFKSVWKTWETILEYLNEHKTTAEIFLACISEFLGPRGQDDFTSWLRSTERMGSSNKNLIKDEKEDFVNKFTKNLRLIQDEEKLE